ncbi:HBR054Cp [Eremothecium sinecaudum]|uniref:HBR054Cp n=1 Tax=Eremothecium sinecaudum TaxID=45286 RepID=A0A125RDZ0_9SACH|nr:HBR054Cp [Eremothecium sinecaudum]AMD18955.1 HBR054Cp [Eremothecium sinecaudum]
MQFTAVASVALAAAAASANVVSNATTVTDYHNATTLVTITSCEQHSCVESVSTALRSTATVTVDNTITIYTTWCPLPSEQAPPAPPASEAPPAPAPETTPAPPAPETPDAPPAPAIEQPSSSVPPVQSTFTGAAARALPAAGALFAGAAALLL